MNEDSRLTPADDPEHDDASAEPEIIEIEGLPGDAPPPSAEDTEDDGDEPVREAGTSAPGEEQALREIVTALEEDLLRVRADFENFRKRQNRDRAESSRLAAAELVTELLPVLDNFRRALEANPGEGELADAYSQGVLMIHGQLVDVLRRAGLTPIETEGQAFDPNFHEAVARHETADFEPNMITAVIEPGYLFRDRLLKAARVCVAASPDA